MKTIEFKPDHLKEIVPRRIDLTAFSGWRENLVEHYKMNPDNPGFTLIHEGVVIACGGVYKLWDGVGEAWVVGSDNIPIKKLSFHKAVIRAIKKIKESKKFHRIQSIVRGDFPEALGWQRLIGFKIEGLMKKYSSDGVDCFLYRMEGL
jgi:hypothetical protein